MSNDVTIGEVTAAIGRARRSILISATVVAALALAYTAISPAKYKAKATLLLPLADARSAASPTIALGSVATPLKILKGVLDSNRCLKMISAETGIKKLALTKAMTVDDSTQDNKLVLSFVGPDKQQDLLVLNTAIKALEQIDRTVGFSMASGQAEILHGAVEKKLGELQVIEAKMLAFQQNWKTPFDPDKPGTAVEYLQRTRELQAQLGAIQKQIDVARANIQSAAVQSPYDLTPIPSLKAWRDKVLQIQYELDQARISAGDNSSKVVYLKKSLGSAIDMYQREVKAQILATDRNLEPSIAELESKKAVLEWQIANAKAFSDEAPKSAVQYQRLYADLVTARSVLSRLREQYEQARVDAEVNKVKWGVLDEPYLEPDATNKSYLLMGVGSFVLTLFLGAIVTVMRHKPAN